MSRVRSSLVLLALVAVAGCSERQPAVGDAHHPPATVQDDAGARPGSDGDRPAVAAASRPPATPPEPAAGDVPLAMRSCLGCHAQVVRAYLGEHGMARSVGALGVPPSGVASNALTRRRYEISNAGDGPWLTTTEEDGGRRRQRLVGRIGAGLFATSWVTAEADPLTGRGAGRLFFAPVETVRDRGLVLAPFEHHEKAPGPDMELSQGCLTCHATRRLRELPGAATGGAGTVFPANALGEDAFDQLAGIGCEGCHGDAAYHLELMAGIETGIGSGLPALGRLPAARQRDVCGRCHLQGDARWELVAGAPDGGAPLPAQIPVLVPAHPGPDFRFVGQLERLELSACYRSTPEMTCTTCHDPHRGPRAQGVAALDAACLACHQDPCSRPPALTVEAVTGAPGRSEQGCVDCHLRRSQPFDLTEVSSADHWVRRRLEPPQTGAGHRQFADRLGALRLFDRERLAPALETPAGAVWEDAVLAMGLVTMGRFDEAREHFDRLPAPGTAAATRPSAPAPLRPVLDQPDLHQTRALTLLAAGRFDEAELAFGDALRLDPLHPGALLGRATLALGRGDVNGVLLDTQTVITAFPRAEHPWRLRLELAERARRPDLARKALEAITERWPSDPLAWQKLGLLLQQEGDQARAAAALRRAALLSPSLDLRQEPR